MGSVNLPLKCFFYKNFSLVFWIGEGGPPPGGLRGFMGWVNPTNPHVPTYGPDQLNPFQITGDLLITTRPTMAVMHFEFELCS